MQIMKRTLIAAALLSFVSVAAMATTTNASGDHRLRREITGGVGQHPPDRKLSGLGSVK